MEGPCTVIRSHEVLPTLHPETILVCEPPSPALTPYLKFFEGSVARRGDSNCTAAGYARELEIPAVFGVEDVMDQIYSGDVIRVNGSMGTVEIIDQFPEKAFYC